MRPPPLLPDSSSVVFGPWDSLPLFGVDGSGAKQLQMEPHRFCLKDLYFLSAWPSLQTRNFRFYYINFYTFALVINTFLYFFLHFYKFLSLKMHYLQNWRKKYGQSMNMNKNNNNESPRFETQNLHSYFCLHFHHLCISGWMGICLLLQASPS